ncbi:MAG: YgiT-type zinc finger protein [Planctomycetes bacterium]|nr:YgiT-type zinc finger protein [Planctomycetota bacterium]MBU4399745.1 YgiT-type zinc finger protein [Planctomycetota bacterium]
MSNSITHCISCGSDKLEKKRRGFPVTVHGTALKVPNIEFYTCSRCGETFLDLDNETKLDLYLKRRRTSAKSKRAINPRRAHARRASAD